MKRLGSERRLLGRPGLDRLQQGVVGKVGVPLGTLVVGVAQHLADGEQIDTAVDHEGRRRVPQVVQA